MVTFLTYQQRLSLFVRGDTRLPRTFRTTHPSKTAYHEVSAHSLTTYKQYKP